MGSQLRGGLHRSGSCPRGGGGVESEGVVEDISRRREVMKDER